jgi:hypothetical protein
MEQPILTSADSKKLRIRGPNAGSSRSRQRLAQLDFDPIGELVEKYRKLEKELQWWEDIRDGRVVALLNNGKERAYSADTHMAIYDKLLTVGDKLLRYGYGREPEAVQEEEKKVPSLVINLTKQGEKFVMDDVDTDIEINDGD